MGSTGHSLFGTSRGGVGSQTFGIRGAVNFTGKLPADTNLLPVGGNKITLKVSTNDRLDVLFQFRLTKDSKFMIITAHDPNTPPVKAKVSVDAVRPSLDKVINSSSGSERASAQRIKALMAKSSEINENQLGAIADNLKRKRRRE